MCDQRPSAPTQALDAGWEQDDGYVELARRAQALALKLAPRAAEADALSTVHEPTRRRIAESGLVGAVMPAEWGGRHARVDPVEVCLVRERLMSVSAHADFAFACQGLGSHALSSYGHPAAQERWLPGLLDLKEIPALALTEPQTGSDLRSLATTLEERDGRLVLTGEKSFISNAGAATFYTVLAKEDDRFSLVVVPAAAEGLVATAGPELTSPHVLGSVAFNDVVLDQSARIGEVAEGWAPVMETLAVFRISVAAAGVGLATRALEIAAKHASERVQFNKPLARQGAVADMLAQSWTEIESARLMTYAAARRARDDPGVQTLPYSSMAKVAGTEAAARVVDRAQQILGRFSMIRDVEIDRLWHAARPLRIYEGATEVLRGTIARELVRVLAS